MNRSAFMCNLHKNCCISFIHFFRRHIIECTTIEPYSTIYRLTLSTSTIHCDSYCDNKFVASDKYVQTLSILCGGKTYLKKNSKTEQRMSFEYFHFHERFAINIPHLYVYAAVFIYGIHLKLNVMHKIECKIRRKLSTRTCDCICLVWINPAFNVSMLCICCCFILRICSFISGWWVSSIDKIQPGI